MEFLKKEEINLSKLEKEVNDAVAAEKLYWQQNDAKFRAINQKVATYDEFRDIVQAAHLKPLERKDKVGLDFKQPWNSAVNDTKSEIPHLNQKLPIKKNLPKNGLEFAREWKRLDKTEESHYQYIISFDEDHIKKIFKVEISHGLLGEIITALNGCYREDDASKIFSILHCMTEVSRFSLSLQFLTESEMSICRQLFEKLSKTVNEIADYHLLLQQVKSKYGLNVDTL